MNTNKPGAIIIEGHIQGLSNTRSLGKAGVPVYVVDKVKCIAQFSKYCTKYYKCPDFILDSFADFLIDLAKKESLKNWILIPSNDHAVYTISKNKIRLEEFFKVITPELDIIENIYDKVRLIKIAEENNVPVPKTQVFETIEEIRAEKIKFPILIKGRNGLSFYKSIGKKVLICRDDNELVKQYYQIKKVYKISDTFSQELIPSNGRNKTVSFTAFCISGNIMAHWTGIKLREHPTQFGTATYTKNTHIEECHKYSERIIKALNYTGVCEIEYLLDPTSEQYKLIEMNPRTWLWVALARDSGVDYARMLYDYMNDQYIEYPQATNSNRYWINPYTDTIFSLLSIFKGKLKISSYFHSIRAKKTINALFVKGDMKPGFAYCFLALSFLKNR